MLGGEHMHPLLAKRIEIPWARISKGVTGILRPMKFTSWKWPVALGMVACSLVPVVLLYCIISLRLLVPQHQVVASIAWFVLGLCLCNQFCQRDLFKDVHAPNL